MPKIKYLVDNITRHALHRSWREWKKLTASGVPPHDTAAEEAFEEAGIAGEITQQSIGSYSYKKIMENGDATRCSVRGICAARKEAT